MPKTFPPASADASADDSSFYSKCWLEETWSRDLLRLIEPDPVDSVFPLALNEPFYRSICSFKCLDVALRHCKWIRRIGAFPRDSYAGVLLGKSCTFINCFCQTSFREEPVLFRRDFSISITACLATVPRTCRSATFTCPSTTSFLKSSALVSISIVSSPARYREFQVSSASAADLSIFTEARATRFPFPSCQATSSLARWEFSSQPPDRPGQCECACDPRYRRNCSQKYDVPDASGPAVRTLDYRSSTRGPF